MAWNGNNTTVKSGKYMSDEEFREFAVKCMTDVQSMLKDVQSNINYMIMYWDKD